MTFAVRVKLLLALCVISLGSGGGPNKMKPKGSLVEEYKCSCCCFQLKQQSHGSFRDLHGENCNKIQSWAKSLYGDGNFTIAHLWLSSSLFRQDCCAYLSRQVTVCAVAVVIKCFYICTACYISRAYSSHLFYLFLMHFLMYVALN